MIIYAAGYGSLPRANHSAPLSDSRLDGGLLVEAPLSSPYCSDNTLPLLETVSEDQEMCSKHRTPVAANQGTRSLHGLETLGGCPVSVLMPSVFLLVHCTVYLCHSPLYKSVLLRFCWSSPIHSTILRLCTIFLVTVTKH